jgi:hypothetical protein
VDDLAKEVLARLANEWERKGGGLLQSTWVDFGSVLHDLTAEEQVSLQGIPEIWMLLPEEVQNYIKELSDALEKQKELKEYTDELYTATTRNAIADYMMEGFSSGKRSAQDFADDFEGMMKDAILQSIKINMLQEPLKEWYKAFSEAYTPKIRNLVDFTKLLSHYIFVCQMNKSF